MPAGKSRCSREVHNLLKGPLSALSGPAGIITSSLCAVKPAAESTGSVHVWHVPWQVGPELRGPLVGSGVQGRGCTGHVRGRNHPGRERRAGQGAEEEGCWGHRLGRGGVRFCCVRRGRTGVCFFRVNETANFTVLPPSHLSFSPPPASTRRSSSIDPSMQRSLHHRLLAQATAARSCGCCLQPLRRALGPELGLLWES